MKKCEQSYAFYLQPDNLQAFAHPLQQWFESSWRTRKHWKQSGKGTEPIPWSPIIRCARPWRETRAQSAINKGAWEGRVVTVTKMFSDRSSILNENINTRSTKSYDWAENLTEILPQNHMLLLEKHSSQRLASKSPPPLLELSKY